MTEFKRMKNQYFRNSLKCWFNDTGYCKFGQECQKRHFSIICSIAKCDKKCNGRHPKLCKFEEKCKFSKKNICAFKHVTLASDDGQIKAHKSQMELLVKENENLKEKVKDLETKIANEKSVEVKTEEHEELKAHKIKIVLFEKENKNFMGKVIELEENITNEKLDSESNKTSFQLKLANFTEQIKSKNTENEDLKNELNIKETKMQNLNTKIRDLENKQNGVDHLQKKVKHLQEINDHYQNEVKEMNSAAAKDKMENTVMIKAKNVELEKLKNTHNILKDLFENQHKKHYNLIETKEMLDKLFEKQTKDLTNKTKIINECVTCRKTLINGNSLKKHSKTIYSKEC